MTLAALLWLLTAWIFEGLGLLNVGPDWWPVYPNVSKNAHMAGLPHVLGEVS